MTSWDALRLQNRNLRRAAVRDGALIGTTARRDTWTAAVIRDARSAADAGVVYLSPIKHLDQFAEAAATGQAIAWAVA
ncbi:hypothetical protein [Micromonospora sp. NPDC023633]|uniref:hypothetical protein n=1 Tax=Micromonospora sp. NPDC023633 TaxID=3154320 RepID=UPI0033EC1714